MATRLLIPTPLRPYTGQKAVVTAEGGTVGELLRGLTTEFVELKPHLYREDGRLRHFVNIYVNDEDIRQLEGENTRVNANDTLSIVPSVAGGSPETVAAPEPALTNDEFTRYSRHLIMPEVGVDGQRKL